MINYNFQPSSLQQIIQETIVFQASTLIKAGVFTYSEFKQNLRDVRLTANENEYEFGTDTERSALIGNPNNRIIQLRFEPVVYVQENALYTTKQLDLLVADISVNRKNDIIRTKIINEEGTIKEVFSKDDYSIQISGVLIGNLGLISNLDYFKLKPEKEIINLINICNSNNAVTVTCPYLNELFNINSIMIESFELQDEQEFKNIQRFSISAYSHNQSLYI
jgi:hypothetical protein